MKLGWLLAVSYPNLAETSHEARPDLFGNNDDVWLLGVVAVVVIFFFLAVFANHLGLTRRRATAWIGLAILGCIFLPIVCVLVVMVANIFK